MAEMQGENFSDESQSEPLLNIIVERPWFPPRSPFHLLQEDLYDDKWKLLVSTIFLENTPGRLAIPVILKFFKKWKTPQDALLANLEEMEHLTRRYGPDNKIAMVIRKFTAEFMFKKWVYPIELYGIGKYGSDTYKIFVTGEWKLVSPEDGILNMYLTWLWENYINLGLD